MRITPCGRWDRSAYRAGSPWHSTEDRVPILGKIDLGLRPSQFIQAGVFDGWQLLLGSFKASQMTQDSLGTS